MPLSTRAKTALAGLILSGLILSALAPTAAMAQPARIERLMDADTNGDGQVSRAEFTAWRAAQFARFDRNGDGFISMKDVPAMLGARFEPRLAQLRNQFDSDHDGRISRHEFVDGPTPGFDMADANHDGMVTRTELDAALARARQARG